MAPLRANTDFNNASSRTKFIHATKELLKSYHTIRESLKALHKCLIETTGMIEPTIVIADRPVSGIVNPIILSNLSNTCGSLICDNSDYVMLYPPIWSQHTYKTHAICQADHTDHHGCIPIYEITWNDQRMNIILQGDLNTETVEVCGQIHGTNDMICLADPDWRIELIRRYEMS